MTNTTSPRTPHAGALSALGNGFTGGLRHWRLMLLAWLAGLAAAALAAAPVAMLLNEALGHQPDAAAVVAGQDIAPIIEGIMTLPDGGAMHAAARIAETLQLPPNAFSYLNSHGSLDIKHVQFFEGLMERISEPADQAAIIHAANVFYRLYGDIFRSLPRSEAHHD